ncbi:ectonucleoside triphosphate diphosphohydrolase 5 isoform X2 [Cotesia glomerata]|uniref:ectonucleoside triphosphate diphosphohydrolase 5 isoform X2 n=1 Tax=Cotesia glomerata TaxID=32391 RepID=UPI001D0114DD|nr:ectonucleoside triphosphate diphosphohydrolase 5 isoform X2 [Cotesia glomerata]
MYYTRLSNGETKDVPPRQKKAVPSSFLKMRPKKVIITLSILFFFYIALSFNSEPLRFGSSMIDRLASSLNLHKQQYVVIIDAGSTGSRVLAFTFHNSILNNDLVLDSELFAEVKPGLSSFADDPQAGVETLRTLLDKAKAVIPESAWAHTPVSMKATAGLRLLPRAKADNIIQECRKFFSQSGFFTTKNSVSIMEGVDEGIFAWFTVNFLTGRLSSYKNDNTAAVLDLGGGSTQITYALDEEDLKVLDKHYYTINAFNRNMTLYTYSYLGMGLMAARKGVLTGFGHHQEDKDQAPKVQEAQEAQEAQEVLVRSECVNPIVSAKWSYAGVNYLVKGPVNGTHKKVKGWNGAVTEEDRPVVRVNECIKVVKNYIDTIDEKPVGLAKHNIYAVSYYYDRATEAGLIDPFTGGVITLQSFHKKLVEICNYPNTDQPFMCLDMTFIYVLLHDAFGLDHTTKLNLYKKYNGHELSWSLGAAFSLLDSDL